MRSFGRFAAIRLPPHSLDVKHIYQGKMRILTAILILSFLSSPESAVAADLRLLGSLSEIAPTGLEYRVTKELKVVAYCPDNTCDIIEAPSTIDNEILNDFTLIFLAYASGYIYLKKPFDRSHPFLEQAKGRLPTVIEKRRNRCRGDEIEVASCILNNIANTHSIKIYISRLDEGAKTKVLQNQEERFSVNALRSVRKWLMEQ